MDKIQRLQVMRDKLTQALLPTQLEIIDESNKHIGHVGAKSGAGHYVVCIASLAFSGKSKIDCHRLVYQALQDLIGTEIHALNIRIV